MATQYPRASFLGIPAEICLAIYKHALALSTLKVGYCPDGPFQGFEVLLVGNFPKRCKNKDWVHHSPWALARICRLVRRETASILAAINLRDVFFNFYAFTPDDMQAWVQSMGTKRICQLRRFSMGGFGWCGTWYEYGKSVHDEDKDEDEDEEYSLTDSDGNDEWFELTGYCHRDIAVDLTRWEQWQANPDGPEWASDIIYERTACSHCSGLHSDSCQCNMDDKLGDAWFQCIGHDKEQEPKVTGDFLIDLFDGLLGGFDKDGQERSTGIEELYALS